MDRNDLILQLAQLLKNNGSKPSISKLTDKNYVTQAKKNDGKDFIKADELRNYLISRLKLSGVDATKAKLFLLMPYSKNQWKVFVVDGNDEVCAQLDDYCDRIIKSENNNHVTYCTSPFVVYSEVDVEK